MHSGQYVKKSPFKREFEPILHKSYYIYCSVTALKKIAVPKMFVFFYTMLVFIGRGLPSVIPLNIYNLYFGNLETEQTINI